MERDTGLRKSVENGQDIPTAALTLVPGAEIALSGIQRRDTGKAILGKLQSVPDLRDDQIAHANRVIALADQMSQMNGNLMPTIQEVESRKE